MTWKGKRVLITGGAGFVGSHLAEGLMGQQAQVTVVDNLVTGKRRNLDRCWDAIRFEEINILDSRFAQLLVEEKYEVIFHLAANSYVPTSVKEPSFDYDTNLLGTFQLLETMRRQALPSVVINISSAAVYGDLAKVPLEEDAPCFPVSPYGVSKLAGERYLAVYAQLYGLRGASARFFSLYGPRQMKQVVYDFIRKLHENPHEMTMYGDGSQVRDLNYVENGVDALLTIAEKAPLRGEVYNVAADQSLSILGLAQLIARLMGISPAFKYTGSVRPGDPQKWIAGIARLRSLGYVPRIGLEEGMRKTIDWFRADQINAKTEG